MFPLRLLLLGAVALLLSGCETLSYYGQAIGGQLDIMSSARPVNAWLADPGTPADLRARLQLAERIRDFASRSLGLPDNGSYRSYVALDRPYVVWNVFAAPRFSVEPKKECFPLAGCVGYRGFFSEAKARAAAQKLQAEGNDVYRGGVPAYSTLGWFDDPLLSTFIRYPDAQLARLIFHELAHQLIYRPGDTTFNESFAVTVEAEGVRRWLEAEGRGAELEAFHAAQGRRKRFAERVKETRERLAAVYKEGGSPELLEKKKQEIWAPLHAEYARVVPEQPNNAFLASVALYTELVPFFEALLRESGGSLEAFYARVRELAKSGKRFTSPKPPGPVTSGQGDVDDLAERRALAEPREPGLDVR
ncbi:MAG TPA: aminopeptidase [Burkholderiales bacterium]|nr:aminopeptidase [Burkholderiales bacterium]